MPFVLDASSALPWCFRDEASGYSDRLLAMANEGDRIHVPAHWPSEILNGVSRAVRRGRLDDDVAQIFLNSLLAYDLVVDRAPLRTVWQEARPLISLYGLSAYDAAYLALAIRRNVALATLDDRLALAAKLEGVMLLA